MTKGVHNEIADPLASRLRRFCKDRGIPLSAEQCARLEELDRLLTEWNRVLDLSGFRDPEERVNRYFLEPLDASGWIPAGEGEILDVGSGGGSPALPLAVVHPEKRWTFLEPHGRRAVFLEEASRRLGLVGARVARARWEEFTPERKFVTVTSRGVSLDEAAVQKMAGWLQPGGRLLLFTGRARSEALAVGKGSLRERARQALAPGLSGWLLVLEEPSETRVASPGAEGGEDPAGENGT